MSLQVKTQAKNLNSYVNYNHPEKIIQYGEKKEVTKLNEDFFMRKLRKEVESLPEKQIEEAKTILSKLGNKTKIASLSGLMVAMPTMAFAKTDEKIVQDMGLPSVSDILQMLGIVIDYSIVLTFSAGAVWLILSRAYYYFTKKHDKAMESASNSIKGMTQVLIAMPVVRILLIMAQLLLGDSPAFHLPI